MEFSDVIKNRRSVRDLCDTPLKENEIFLIVEAGKLAPIAMGKYDKLLFTLIEKEELKKVKDIFLSSLNRDLFYGGSLLIIISQKDEIVDLYNQNAGCILENMMLEATNLGIGSVYLYSPIRVSRANPNLSKVLHIKEGYTPIAAAIFGYKKTNKINDKVNRKVLIERY